MTNDYQGRLNPASRPAAREHLRRVGPVLVILILIFWSMS